MNKFTTSLATVAALLAGGLVAVPTPAYAAKVAPKQPGVLHVYDQGALFTKAGIDKAKATMGDVQFDHGLTLTIDTYPVIPKEKTEPTEGEKAKFFQTWAKEAATGDKAKGVYVLVCRSPGYVEVIADKTTRDRGFSAKDEQKLRDTLINSFRAAKDKPEAEQFKLRDEALSAAVDYVISDLKDTVVPTSGTASTTSTTAKKSGPGGYGVAGWICLGLTVLLCVWLVIGLLRALTGGGGGGGYGGGGGGGGGGFGMGLMGGLFGAMAGMWLYNSMMGTHYGSDAYAGGDNYNNNNDNGGGADTSGDGDFSGDAGAGGSYDDGGSGGDTGGGGDYGDSGGGDTGGGGDFGGGDFGGGGGDF